MDTESEAESRPVKHAGESKKSALSTIKALQFVTLKDFDHERAWARYCNAIFRGAATGFCLRGGLHLLKFIFSIILRRKRNARPQPVSDMIADTLRYTGFLGAFAGIYVSVDEGIAAVFGKERCKNNLCCRHLSFRRKSPNRHIHDVLSQLPKNFSHVTGRHDGEHSSPGLWRAHRSYSQGNALLVDCKGCGANSQQIPCRDSRLY